MPEHRASLWLAIAALAVAAGTLVGAVVALFRFDPYAYDHGYGGQVSCDQRVDGGRYVHSTVFRTAGADGHAVSRSATGQTTVPVGSGRRYDARPRVAEPENWIPYCTPDINQPRKSHSPGRLIIIFHVDGAERI